MGRSLLRGSAWFRWQPDAEYLPRILKFRIANYTFVDYATQAYTALVLSLILLFHNSTVPRWGLLAGVHAALLVAIHLLIRWNAAPGRPPPVDFFRHFYPVLLYTFFFSETGWLNRMFFPNYLDALAIRADQALFGWQPGVSFMTKLPFLPVSELFYASYFSYYVMIAGVGLALFLRERRQFFHYISVVSFVFYICYAIYVVIPIIGPRVMFQEIEGFNLPESLRPIVPDGSFPEAVTHGVFFHIMAWIYRVFEAPGAAFPSSHVAIAWCTVYFSFKYLRPIRWFHAPVAFLLTLSTMYCRYHYVVDVLAGLVTTALLLPLANYLYFRSLPDQAHPEGRAPAERNPA